MGQIPRETVERIIDENDIVEVIGGYFPLKRGGSNFKALCPFHTEKSPSFNVNPHRQTFHCFGCGEGGDVIKFVMKYENIPFPDAARKLGDRVGVPIEEESFDPKQEAKRQMRREVQTMHRKAAEWFHYLLFKKPFAQAARDYLKKRGLGMEVSRCWQFGYAPEHAGLLIDWAKSEGYSVNHLVAGGLASWRDDNQPQRGAYARFRNRLMFPVSNDMGDVIAFSGRVLAADQPGGKYVNSPETMLFNKSKTLYGFDKSKRAVLREGRAIIVEGQLDMIAAFESGIENIVAPLGTALTELNARALKRHTDEVVLCYDSDEAGYNAAVKAFQQLAKVGVLVRVASLPEGEDPDSFIQKNGAEVLRDLLEKAPEFFDFQINRKGAGLNLQSLRDRINFARELAINIALVEDKMLQDSLISQVITRIGVGETEVRRLVRDAKQSADRSERATQRRATADMRREAEKGPENGEGYGESIQPGPVAELPLSNRSVKLLCQLLLCDTRSRTSLVAEAPPDFLRDIPDTELLAKIWRGDFDPDSAGSVASFVSTLDAAEQRCISRLLHEPLPVNEGNIAGECIGALRRQSFQNRLAQTRARMNNPRLSPGELEMLTKELLDLTNQLNDIPAPPNGSS